MPDVFEYCSPYQKYKNCYFVVNKYVYGDDLAISIYNDEVGPIANVTVNLDEPIPAGCIAVKDYSENTGMLLEMQKIGLVTEVVGYRNSGFVTIPICKYDKNVLERYAVQ